jgi:hypothetical protein
MQTSWRKQLELFNDCLSCSSMTAVYRLLARKVQQPKSSLEA